jgi:hypothetical protein
LLLLLFLLLLQVIAQNTVRFEDLLSSTALPGID